jgi:HEAT repeat protein
MTEPNNVEETITILEEGTEEEQKEALETLKELSYAQPGDLVPYLNIICGFVREDELDIRHNIGIILANVADDDSSAVTPYADTVRTLLTDDRPFVLSSAMRVATHIAIESPSALADVTDRLVDLLTYEKEFASTPACDTRMNAAATLGNLGEADRAVAARSDAPLADRLVDSESDVRAAAVIAVTQLGLAHPDTVSTALTHLPTRLDDDHAGVRRNAIWAYNRFRMDQPDAISQPNVVAPAFEQATERANLDDTETRRVTETYQYINNMAADDH